MSQTHELLDIARSIVQRALPGEALEAYVTRARTTSVRAYGGEVESLSSAEPVGAGIRVIVEGRQGFAWAGTLDETVLKETLEEARDNAGFAEPDEFAGLATDDGHPPVELDLVSPLLTAAPTAAKVDLAIELERLALAADPRVKGVRVASYSDSLSQTAIASTAGIEITNANGLCYVSVSPLLEQDGDTQIGSGFSGGRAHGDLDLDRAVEEGVGEAASLLGATKPAARRVTVVLSPDVTASFLSIIGGTLSGEAVLKGRSLFANRELEQVAAGVVTLASDPTDPGAFGASRYDGEGLARRRLPLIEQGVLQGFLYDTYSGRRAGRASTASASRAMSTTPHVGASSVTLAPGERSHDELIADVADGVLVLGVSGLHSGVNPVSGDFSVGATGRMIRDGALAEPFREATIASTLQRMLLDVVAVGADHRWMPEGSAGVTIVIKDVSLGGT